MSKKARRRPSTPQSRKARHIPGVVIAYIHPGEVSAYFVESMQATQLADVAARDLGERPRRIVNILQEWSSANVSDARNKLTARFLDTRTPDGATVGDWLLWVDADMQWEPDALDLLMESADPIDRPIVGGLCFGMSSGELVPTIYQWARTDDGELVTYRVANYERDSLVRCAATGAAFILIHRSVLEAMRAANFNPAFPFFQEVQMGARPVGEDITFCIRAGQLGFPVFVDTRAKIGHHKSQLLTEDAYLKQTPPPLDGKVGLVIPTRGDHPDLLRAIIATSGLPAERVVVVWTGEGEPPELAATVERYYGPLNIHRWWNVGIDLLDEAGCTRVAVLNDDVVIAPDTLPRMVRGLAGATLALLDEEGPSGHCWVLNVTHGVRPDESFRWHCGDFQLIADASAARGVVRVPDTWCLHLTPTKATTASPELAALAAADDALYDSRHPAGSRFAAVRS